MLSKYTNPAFMYVIARLWLYVLHPRNGFWGGLITGLLFGGIIGAIRGISIVVKEML